MKKSVRQLAGLFSCAAIALAFASEAYALSGQDVVRHGSNSTLTVRSNGTCVRTKWDAGNDPCGQARIARAERTVYFGFNTSNINQNGQSTLDSLAARLNSDTSIKQARVVGFADRVGSASYNERLSKARAEVVTNYLASRGFTKMGATETRWFGESNPATDCGAKMKGNALVKCLAKDRRVEVEIEYLDETASNR